MIDFVNSIGETFTNIINFIVSTVETFRNIGAAVSNFFTSAGAVISILPVSVQVSIYTAVGLILAFIVIELLRDFL